MRAAPSETALQLPNKDPWSLQEGAGHVLRSRAWQLQVHVGGVRKEVLEMVDTRLLLYISQPRWNSLGWGARG